MVRSREELEGAVEQLGSYGQGLYAERWAPFVKVGSLTSWATTTASTGLSFHGNLDSRFTLQ